MMISLNTRCSPTVRNQRSAQKYDPTYCFNEIPVAGSCSISGNVGVLPGHALSIVFEFDSLIGAQRRNQVVEAKLVAWLQVWISPYSLCKSIPRGSKE